MNTELKYRTFDQLLAEVNIDFTMYNNENLIEPAQLIKVAQRVSYDLGLRIHGTKEVMLEIENRKTRLPDDFYVLNYAVLCTTYKVTEPVPSGRHTENVVVNLDNPCKKCCQTNCSCEYTYIQECPGNECQNGENIYVQVVEKRKTETRIYDTFDRITISPVTGRGDALTPGYGEKAGYIKNGFLYTNVDHGKLFISYQGALEDDEGNLLVLDHPQINEYYEYAIKQRILENLYINGEDVTQRLGLIEQRLKAARNYALTIVNTPDFKEMYNVWRMNRKAMYARYYDMFKTRDGY